MLEVSMTVVPNMSVSHAPDKITISGHRDLTEQEIGATLREIYKRGFSTLYCGMARGTDIIAARIAIESGVRVHGFIPCLNHIKKWTWEDKREFHYICSSEMVTYEYVSEEPWHRGCELSRNTFMLSKSQVLVAFAYKKKSGTSYTINKAMEMNLPLYIYNPKTKEWS